MDNFKNKWLNSRVDYDSVYGFQCVDLIKQYLKEVYGLTPGSWGNAIDYWTKTNPTILTKFDKVASQSPQKGDIVILNGTSTNPYGHISIAVDSNTMLEQNGSTGNGSGTGNDAIRLRAIPKTRIAGLLRPKTQSPQGGNNVFNTDEEVKEAYIFLRGNAGTPAERKGWIGQPKQRFFTVGLPEANGYRQQLAEVKQALANEKAKPPKEVIKEVTKIVEKPVEVIKQVEVVKEVEPTWLTATINFIRKVLRIKE